MVTYTQILMPIKIEGFFENNLLPTGGLGPRVISETRRPETSLKSADYQVFCCLGPRGDGGDATARGSTLTTPSSDTKLCLPLSSFYHQVNTKIKLSKLQTTDDVVLVINSITMALGQIIITLLLVGCR